MSQTQQTRRILIVQYSSNRDGSAFSGLLLADGLREAGWTTHVAFGFEGPIIERYAKADHCTHVVPHKNWLRRGCTHQFLKDGWLEWQKADAFDALIQSIKPDIVYLNTVVSLAAAVAARRCGVPCVWHLREMFADIGGEMHAPQWARPLVSRLIRHASERVVANSAATAKNLLGEQGASVPIIPNAVRSEFFDCDIDRSVARHRFQLPQDAVVIGVPGTLRPLKGHPFFFRAVAPLLHRRSDCTVAVTGGGDSAYTEGLRAQLRDLGVLGQVRFVGWVEDMTAFYRACDLCCIPSRAESFGRTVIEAFASGTPVVATAVGGMREIIEEGTTGLLVPYGAAEELAEALRIVLDAPELRHKMSHHARQDAEAQYHEAVYKERIVSVTNELIRNGYHLSGA